MLLLLFYDSSTARCTREQRAFLSNARVTTALYPASLAPPVTPEFPGLTEKHHTMADGNGSAAAPSLLGSRGDHVIRGSGKIGGQWMQEIGQQVGQPGGGGGDMMEAVGDAAWGFSNTVMEEIDDIERACSKRALALEEDASFLESFVRPEVPAVVV